LLPALVQQSLDFLKTPPLATLAILGIAAALGLVTSLINVKMMDLKEYRQMMLDSARVQHQMMEAAKSGNQRAIDKARKRQSEVMGRQSKMSTDRLKISLFFFVPFLLIWQVLGNFFGSTPIASFPFVAPFIPMDLSVQNWYLICSFATNILISHVLGLTFEIDPSERESPDEK
jgi:uncharacterized membrane protein (DUF106 family)